MTTRRRWTPETIELELSPIVAELGRMPKRDELTERGLSGLWSAMSRNGGLTVWRERMSAPATTVAPISHEEISQRAYFLALEQGGGDPMAHWLSAERELTQPALA